MNLPPDDAQRQYPENPADHDQCRGNEQKTQDEVDAIDQARLPKGCTMRDVLKESIGYYIICQHLIGSSSIVYREGLLTRVESNCYTLYDEDNRTYITCDYFSLKMFQRYPRNERPPVKISQIIQDLELARLKNSSNPAGKR